MGAYKNPIVLLHGTGLDSSMWDGFRRALVADGASEDSIFTLDLLGHGETPRPSRPLHIDDYVRQVRKLVLRQDLGRIQILGHSLGGIAALAFARAHPDLTDDAAVIGVPYGRSDTQRNEWLDLIMQATALDEDDDTSDPVGEIVPQVVQRWCRQADSTSATYATDRLLRVDPVTFGLVFRIAMTSENAVEEMAPEISVPIVVAAGSNDSEVDAAGVDELARAINRGTSVVIDGHHHLGVVEQPDSYLQLLH